MKKQFTIDLDVNEIQIKLPFLRNHEVVLILHTNQMDEANRCATRSLASIVFQAAKKVYVSFTNDETDCAIMEFI